jgi:hypothetical protein
VTSTPPAYLLFFARYFENLKQMAFIEGVADALCENASFVHKLLCAFCSARGKERDEAGTAIFQLAQKANIENALKLLSHPFAEDLGPDISARLARGDTTPATGLVGKVHHCPDLMRAIGEDTTIIDSAVTCLKGDLEPGRPNGGGPGGLVRGLPGPVGQVAAVLNVLWRCCVDNSDAAGLRKMAGAALPFVTDKRKEWGRAVSEARKTSFKVAARALKLSGPCFSLPDPNELIFGPMAAALGRSAKAKCTSRHQRDLAGRRGGEGACATSPAAGGVRGVSPRQHPSETARFCSRGILLIAHPRAK